MSEIINLVVSVLGSLTLVALLVATLVYSINYIVEALIKWSNPTTRRAIWIAFMRRGDLHLLTDTQIFEVEDLIQNFAKKSSQFRK